MPSTMLTLGLPDADWMRKAACAGRWGLMEAADEQLQRAARMVCADCPVWRDCRTWVLSLPPRQDVAGMAGGLTEAERVRVRRQIRRRRVVSAEVSKTCTKCGETKPLGAFYARPDTRYGREAQCMECQRKKKREYKAARRAAEAEAVAS